MSSTNHIQLAKIEINKAQVELADQRGLPLDANVDLGDESPAFAALASAYHALCVAEDEIEEYEERKGKPTIVLGRPETAHHDAAQAVFAADPVFCKTYTDAWFANIEGKESDIDNLSADLDRRVKAILEASGFSEHPIRQYV